MRLVNGKEGDGHLGDALQKVAAHQTLRRNVKEIQLALMETAQHLAGLACLEGGVVKVGPHPVFPQGVNLILHQRNQGAHHEADPGPVQGRDLVTKRFAAAGGHQHKGILTPDQSGDDFLLVLPELAVAEDIAQAVENCWVGVAKGRS